MGMLEEAKAEIMERRGRHAAEKPAEKATRPRKEKRDMTKEEREAYRQKKMEEEEARILKKSRAPSEGSEKAPRRKSKRAQLDGDDARVCEKDRPVARLKALQPLEPLYLLRIPGLPKGDCLAICYARGSDK